MVRRTKQKPESPRIGIEATKLLTGRLLLQNSFPIAAFLDRETDEITALLHKARASIAMLGEYRTALISAAVTAKIDVRREASS